MMIAVVGIYLKTKKTNGFAVLCYTIFRNVVAAELAYSRAGQR